MKKEKREKEAGMEIEEKKRLGWIGNKIGTKAGHAGVLCSDLKNSNSMEKQKKSETKIILRFT